MAGKETAGPRFTMSSGSCSVDQGTSSAATGLNLGRVLKETRESVWQQRENQAANRIQVCRVCLFAFTDMKAFEKHTTDHLLGKSHNCSECGKLFVNTWNLTRHLITHGEPSFECGVCGKKFYRNDVRKKHKLSCHVGAEE